MNDGVPTMTAEWQIFNFRAKILAALRSPIVSPAFHMYDQDDLRLMIYPQVKVRNGMRMRDEKELFTKRVAGGKLSASLSLKVPNPKSVPLRYTLKVGQTQRGLLEFNFGSTAIDSQGTFDINWLDELNSDGSLTVAMVMLQPEGGDVAA